MCWLAVLCRLEILFIGVCTCVQDAERGLAMTNMQVVDRPITVESAAAASMAKPGTEPGFSMLQLHQLAQVCGCSLAVMQFSAAQWTPPIAD